MTLDITAFIHDGTYTITYVVSEPEGEHCAIVDSVLDYDPVSGRTSTEMASYAAVDKSSPDEIASKTMIGVEAGDSNIEASEGATFCRTELQNNPEGLKADTWLSAAESRPSMSGSRDNADAGRVTV